MIKFTIKRSEWLRGKLTMAPEVLEAVKKEEERSGMPIISFSVLSAGPKYSALYIPGAEKYCCLGLYCRDIVGIPKEKLAFIGQPDDDVLVPLYKSLPEEKKWLFEVLVETDQLEEDVLEDDAEFVDYFKMIVKDYVDTAIETNDNDKITDELREKELIGLFAKLGIAVTFVD
jgi:hypothetical protein